MTISQEINKQSKNKTIRQQKEYFLLLANLKTYEWSKKYKFAKSNDTTKKHTETSIPIKDAHDLLRNEAEFLKEGSVTDTILAPASNTWNKQIYRDVMDIVGPKGYPNLELVGEDPKLKPKGKVIDPLMKRIKLVHTNYFKKMDRRIHHEILHSSPVNIDKRGGITTATIYKNINENFHLLDKGLKPGRKTNDDEISMQLVRNWSYGKNGIQDKYKNVFILTLFNWYKNKKSATSFPVDNSANEFALQVLTLGAIFSPNKKVDINGVSPFAVMYGALNNFLWLNELQKIISYKIAPKIKKLRFEKKETIKILRFGNKEALANTSDNDILEVINLMLLMENPEIKEAMANNIIQLQNSFQENKEYKIEDGIHKTILDGIGLGNKSSSLPNVRDSKDSGITLPKMLVLLFKDLFNFINKLEEQQKQFRPRK